MKKEKKQAEEKPAPKPQTDLSKEYAGMSLSDIYHYEIIKLTERRNVK